MDETKQPEKVKMVFVGGKKAPTGYRIGEVVLNTKRYLTLPWFKPLPEGKDAKIGDLVSLEDIPGTKERVRVKMPERRPGNKALSEVEGKFSMRFRNNVEGVPIRNAPGNLVHGQTYELSLRHSNLPWFELIEEPGKVIIPSSEDQESVYDEEEIFVPPEAVDEETDFEELEIDVEPPGPYTSEELAEIKRKQDEKDEKIETEEEAEPEKEGKLEKEDFAEADEEERETGLLRVETPEIVEEPKIEPEQETEDEDELTPEEKAYLEKEEAKIPSESEIKKMNKIGLVTFIKDHDGEANMRMKRDDLLTAALAIRENLEE